MTQHAGCASGPLGRCAKGIALGVLVVLCACEAESGRVLARAAGHELTVDQMVEILARQNTVPNQPDVVDALANFWIDYTLIGVRARDDSLFTTLDLDPLLQPQLDQETIDTYMNSVVRPDTAISESDLRTMWEADPPADSVRAQHILLAFPEQGTQAQVDSVAAFAAQLKERAAAGDLPAEWFCFVHHETTLGEMNPWSLVENVRAVLPGPKILVDAISSFGATDVEWGQADVILGVANKCLHAVAGTSFVIFRKALLSDELPEKTSVYLDLEQYLDGAVPFTLPPQVLIAFRQALREAHDVRGREGRYRHLNDLIWREARALGLEPVIGQETSGYLLASFYLPEGVAYADLYEEMHDRGFVIYAGQGALKDRIFRIANMGDLLDEALVKEFFAGVGEVARARRASGLLRAA